MTFPSQYYSQLPLVKLLECNNENKLYQSAAKSCKWELRLRWFVSERRWMAEPLAKIHSVTVVTNISAGKTKHEISMMAENSVCHSVYNVAARLQGNSLLQMRVHIRRIETPPQGQGSSPIVYYNELHLGMQSIKKVAVWHSCSYSSHIFPDKISYQRYGLNHWQPPAVFFPPLSLGVILLFTE